MNKYYHRQSMPERLATAGGAIAIVQADPELAEALKTVGYQEEQFAEGSRRVDAAALLDIEQETCKGAQVAATARLKAIFQEMRRFYGDDKRLVRTALRDNEELFLELRLHLKMKSRQESLIRQMVHFYNEVVQHPVVIQALSDQYIGRERFTVRQGQIKVLVNALQVQQHLQGKAIVTQQKRREAMKELDVWMTDFIRMARAKFGNNAEQLRKLGIGVKIRR